MDRSDMIFKLLKSLNDKQDNQSEVLTRVEADLKYHIKRTDIIEERIKGTITWKHISMIVATVGAIITILKTTGVT